MSGTLQAMKTWVAALIGIVALAAVTGGAWIWTGAGAAEQSDPYWECMSEYGFSPDTPADAVDVTAFDQANDACD